MANSLRGSGLVDNDEAETSQKDHEANDDDSSSNSYMDSLFGYGEVIPNPTAQEYKKSDESDNMNHHPSTSQQRLQQLMQHQMRLMTESYESSQLNQHQPVATSSREANVHQQNQGGIASPSFAHSGIISAPAYQRQPHSIGTSMFGQSVSYPSTRELDSSLLADNTTHNTPLARLYAMAGEFFPPSGQESSANKRQKRLGASDSSISDIPVTSMSPSLAISTLDLPRVAKKRKTIQRRMEPESRSPQHVMSELLQSKGLPLYRVCAVEAKYDTLPSPLQLASYGIAVMKAVVSSDVAELDALLKTGLSPNPCNQFRDSLLDYACETSNTDAFHCFLRHNADIRVCDAFGRTPLHYCAWSETFNESIVRAILEKDPQQLFQEDKQGRTPLEVASKCTAQEWIDFLVKEKESLFRSLPPLKCLQHRVQLSDPPNPLPTAKAKAVSSGRIPPQDIPFPQNHRN